MAAAGTTPPDEEAAEAAAWADFVRALGAHLAGQWPAMPERLGDRYDAFVDLAVQQGRQRGLARAPSIARYVNLWFVWGPAFHDKPGFEWAQGLLAAPAAREWVTVHQLVRRSLAELERLPGARVEPQALAAADERLLERFGALGAAGRMRRPEPLPLPRAACDLEAAELRVLDDGARQAYDLAGGEWQRLPVAAPPPLRIDAAHPLPALIALLSPQSGQGPRTKLQVRLRAHAACHGDVHPALAFCGPHGRWRWAGHETRAVSFAVATRDQPLPPGGPGCAVAEETAPEPQRLLFETCGLRDEGDPLGAFEAAVSVWPSEQWWLELQRAVPAAQALLPGPRAWTRGVTRCRVERDGAPQDAAPLRHQFEAGLDAEVAVAAQKLAAAWEQLPGLGAPSAQALLGLLVGKAAATWGWRHGAAGLDGAPLMRLVALLEMDACQADIELGGELDIAGAKARLALRAVGQAPLRAEIRREAAAPPMAAAMQAAHARWRLPFTLALDPLAGDSGALLQVAGPVSGALVGEAGLRPGTKGASGWEWFVALRVEAVAVALRRTDPLLGDSRFVQPLLPALPLIDWSLG